MNRRNLVIALVTVSAGALLVGGCNDTTNAPPPQAMTPRNDPPPKVPTTKEEKIEAIKRAPIPEERKKQEIARIQAEG